MVGLPLAILPFLMRCAQHHPRPELLRLRGLFVRQLQGRALPVRTAENYEFAGINAHTYHLAAERAMKKPLFGREHRRRKRKQASGTAGGLLSMEIKQRLP